MFFKRLRVIAISMIASTVSMGEEIVSTSGVFYGLNKIDACEGALDNARREAAQAATSVVSSKFTSIERDTGISQVSDEIVTSKAYAKLLEKEESISLIQESGQIRCKVVAKFKSGVIVVNNKLIPNESANKKSPLNQSDNKEVLVNISRIKSVNFTAGPAFCLKYLYNACFREYYDPIVDVWGIQSIGGKRFSSLAVRESHLFLIESIKGTKMDSKEVFIKWYENAIESLTKGTVIFSRITGYTWNRSGYVRNKVNTWINGQNKRQVSFFTTDDEFKDSALLKINEKLRKSLIL